MSALSGRAFTFAWRHLYRIPEPVLAAAFDVAADLVWLRHGAKVRRLESNVARVRPDLPPRAVRKLSRAGMRSYLRYYREAFVLAHIPPAQLPARVRLTGAETQTLEALANGTSVIAALGHMGNWDLAGAWACQYLAPVTTVAERLKPQEVYEDFLRFRTSLGMKILTFGDTDVTSQLRAALRQPGTFVPLLADRDLGRHGVEVDICGHKARVAPGPAALALNTGAALVPIGLYYERLTGERRRLAGSRWGLVVDFAAPVSAEGLTGTSREKTAQLTQRWVDQLVEMIAAHPQDWHMLQKVFVADLDPARDAQVRSGETS